MIRLSIALVIGALVVGCAAGAPSSPVASPATANAAPAAATPTIKKPGEASSGDRTVCLVSNEEFTVSPASPKVEWGGKTYYFCCAGCDKTFEKNPQKYLNGNET